MKTRIAGDLMKNAVTRRYADGTSVVLVVLAPATERGMPVLAERAFGATPAASYAAGLAAQQMRKGCSVVVHGHQLATCQHDGQLVVCVTAVNHIEHDMPAPFHETKPAAEAA